MPIYLQHGNLIDYVPPTDTSTEDVVFMGGLVGIPQAFIPAGELGALSVDGVYMFTKKDGVSVNLGEVVKYCGTTKLAQDSNADLTLGVAVADAEADSLGVKVKINSVLPTEGGGGGGGGSGDGLQNLATGEGALSILGTATTSEYSITIGDGASANNNSAIALGEDAIANGNSSVAIGWNASTSLGGATSLAIGTSAQVNGGGASAVGSNVVTEASSSANFGYNTKLYDKSVASIGTYAYYENGLRTQLYVIAEGSPLSQQYLNGKAGLAYAVWGDAEIFTNGKVKEGKIIAFETLFSNGVDFVPTTEAGGGGCLCC